MPLAKHRPDPLAWSAPAVEPNPGWMAQARCLDLDRDEDPDDWFPEGFGQVPMTNRAVEACGGCKVREECLDYALAIEGTLTETGRHGVWGGLTPGQRAKLAKGGAA